MYPESIYGVDIFECFMQFILWSVTIFILWRIFENEDWPGWTATVPIFNVVVVGTIAARAGWWAVRNTLKEVILIGLLTVACLMFIPGIVEASATLSVFIKLMPPSIIGGFLLAKKLGRDDYTLYVPSTVIAFAVVILIGISISVTIFAIRFLGAEGVQTVLAESEPKLGNVNTDILMAMLNFGIFISILSTIAGIPCLFVCGFIGAWIGEKIGVRFLTSDPDIAYAEICTPVPSEQLFDSTIAENSPLRFRAQNAAEESKTEEKTQEEIADLEKLKA